MTLYAQLKSISKLRNGFKQLAFGDDEYTNIVIYVKLILVLVKYN